MDNKHCRLLIIQPPPDNIMSEGMEREDTESSAEQGEV